MDWSSSTRPSPARRVSSSIGPNRLHGRWIILRPWSLLLTVSRRRLTFWPKSIPASLCSDTLNIAGRLRKPNSGLNRPVGPTVVSFFGPFFLLSGLQKADDSLLSGARKCPFWPIWPLSGHGRPTDTHFRDPKACSNRSWRAPKKT